MGTSTILSLAAGTPTISFDWIIFSIIAAVFALESFRSGSARTAAFAVALPLAFLLSSWLTTAFAVGPLLQHYVATPILQTLVFGVIFLFLFFLMYRTLYAGGTGAGSVLEAVISGFAATIILMVLWPIIPGLSNFWQFGDSLSTFFGASYRAFWQIGRAHV